MSINEMCTICGGYIRGTLVHTLSSSSNPPIRLCTGHETTDAEIAAHVPFLRTGKLNYEGTFDIGGDKPELVTIPPGSSVYPNFLQQEEVLWQIAQDVAETTSTYYNDNDGYVYCPFCMERSTADPRTYEITHSSSCIVTKARELIKQREARPQMEIKLHVIADETTIASALIHQKESGHQPSPLHRLVEEAQQQIANGEFEEGGFAVEGRAQTSEQKREVIEQLYQLWLRRPTLRFSQLLLNCFQQDFYGVEDFQLIENLKAFYDEMDRWRVNDERIR